MFLLLAANLCVADIGVAATTMAMHAFRYLQHAAGDRRTEAERWDCAASVAAHLWDVATNENLFTIFLMTLSHFVTIKWPHRCVNVVSQAGTLVAVALTWLVSAGLGLTRMILVVATNTVTNAATNATAVDGNGSSDATYCGRLRNYRKLAEVDGKHTEALFSASVATMLLVYATMFIVYACVFRHVWTRTLRRGSNPKSDDGFRTRVRLARRTAVTILLLLGSFTVLWLPVVIYSALRTLNVLSPSKERPLSLRVAQVALATLVSVSGIVDPVLYGVRLPDVQRAIRRYLCPTTSNHTSTTDGEHQPQRAKPQ